MDAAGQTSVGRVPASDLAEVAVSGDLDLTAVPRLGAALDTLLAQDPVHVVVDLTDCRYIDAAGIALLLDTHRRLWRCGSRLTLRSPSRRLRGLLRVARVDTVLHMVPATLPDDEPVVGP